MTPREALIAALTFQTADGPPPHLELEFHITREMFGQDALNAATFRALPHHQRGDALARNAELWVKVADTLGWSAITGFHDLPADAQAKGMQRVRDLAGDRFMRTAAVSGTLGIPDADDIGALISKIAGDPDGLMEELDTLCRRAEADIRTLAEGGAELIFLVTDYAFHGGPFLSPAMFARFVSPFARRLASAARAHGAFVVQHSDGDLRLMLDEMLGWGLDGFHGLDPRAGMDIRTVRERVGGRWVLFGGVDSVTLRNEGVAEAEQSALHSLRYGPWNGSGHVFTSSNCIYAGTPPENYRAMLAARAALTPASGNSIPL